MFQGREAFGKARQAVLALAFTMYRALPTGNKICNQRFQDRCHELHRKRLMSIKAAVDNRPPPKYVHLIQNLKKQQMDEERYSAIERENYLLLDKMSYIMTHPQSSGGGPVTKKVVNNRSLNKEARKRELTKITEENRHILKRIQHKEPYYNHLDWEYERKIQEGYLNNICEYPYVLGENTGRHLSALEEMEKPNLAEYLDSKYGAGEPIEAAEAEEAESQRLRPPQPPTRTVHKKALPAKKKTAAVLSSSGSKSVDRLSQRQRELDKTVDELLAEQEASRPASAETGGNSARGPGTDAAPVTEPEPEAAADADADAPASEEPAAEEPANDEPGTQE